MTFFAASSARMTVKVAPGSTAPVWSTTVTSSFASRAWAKAGAEWTSRSRAVQQAAIKRVILFILGSRPNLKSAWINLLVESKAVERRLFSGVGAEGTTQAERQLDAIDVAVVGEIQPVLRGSCRLRRSTWRLRR